MRRGRHIQNCFRSHFLEHYLVSYFLALSLFKVFTDTAEDVFPPIMLQRILEYLDEGALNRLALVCKNFYHLLKPKSTNWWSMYITMPYTYTKYIKLSNPLIRQFTVHGKNCFGASLSVFISKPTRNFPLCWRNYDPQRNERPSITN